MASLICGIIAPCGAGLLSIIFGAIALSQIKKRDQRGRGMAIAGIGITIAWLLAIVAIVVIAVLSTSADRDDSGEITGGGRVSIESLSIGDCVEELTESDNLTSVQGVPCSEPHEGEVFAKFDLPGGAFPGEAAIYADAENGCVERLESYSAEAFDDPSVELFYIAPNQGGWDSGDREVICVTYYPGGPRTGALNQ